VTLHAYLVPASPAYRAADLPSIVAAGNRRLAQHQRVASASWWPDVDFPRTGLGKVRRHLLPRPTVATGSVQVDGVLAVDDPVGQAIARVARLASVDAHRTLEQLGIDSIGVVELAVALEEGTGRRIADDALRPDMTVERLRRVVAEAAPADVESLGVGPAPGGTPALWPYTWGRVFRFLAWPVDLLYRAAVTKSTVLGAERLDAVPRGRAVIVAGTHHSFPDLALVRWGLEHSPLRGLSRRTVVVVRGEGMQAAGPYATYASLAFGLFPLRRQGGYGGDLQQLARLMSAGNALLIFPQGRHSRPEQERAGDPAVDFQPGVAVLAQSLDALVVPFGLAGTERMMPAFLETFRGMVIARTIPLAIRVGPLAIAFGDPLSPRPDEEPSAFASRLQVVCYDLTRRAEAALRTPESTAAGR
jgi:1-acyl-sn-glycerol-3-phosphate acyltransferase/acyl carrier protein